MIRLLKMHTTLATALTTVITVVLIGGVAVATTRVGCGPAGAVGVKLSVCAAQKTGLVVSPAPTIYPSAKGGFTPAATPSYAPQPDPGTSYPPVALPPGSSGQAPIAPIYQPGSGIGFPALTCTLPIFAGPPGSGGFVSFPGGAFTADPRSAVALPSPGNSGPGYGGGYGMTFDRPHSRWLPVSWQLVSPDGTHYAFQSQGGVYLVDASTNGVTELGQGRQWNVVRVLNDRVYATVVNAPGFWVLPASGTPTEVTAQGYWQAATTTAAFGSATSAVPQGATQELMKLDIATGAISSWFSISGASVYVQGFDAHGNPIVQANYASSWEIWVATGANNGYVLLNDKEFVDVQGSFFADSHGVWFPLGIRIGQGSGLALYVEGSGIYVMSSYAGQLAGPCS